MKVNKHLFPHLILKIEQIINLLTLFQLAKKHELNVHYPELSKKYACNECPATFHDKSKLRLHSLKHSTIKPYVCEQCGKGFNWAASFQVRQI